MPSSVVEARYNIISSNHIPKTNDKTLVSACQTGLCHPVHTDPDKKRCGFKNVRIRVNVAMVTANCEKHLRSSIERAFY